MTHKHTDKANGRAKEAVGALTGDKALKDEGRANRAKVSAKKTVDKVAETLIIHNRRT
jgi:uncharacterized protein YjbJ (UPF0337 family)